MAKFRFKLSADQEGESRNGRKGPSCNYLNFVQQTWSLEGQTWTSRRAVIC